MDMGYFKINNPNELYQENITKLEDHLFRTSNIFAYLTELGYLGEEGLQPCRWLSTASGIENINYDSIRFDTSVTLCEEAYYQTLDFGRQVSLLLKEIAIFNFVWGTFEMISKKILSFPKKNLARRVAVYLFENFESSNCLLPYHEALQNELYEKSLKNIQYNKLRTSFKLKVEINNKKFIIGRSGLALEPIVQLRNKIAHGDFLLSEDLLEQDIENDIQVISISSRILLLIIQMILITKYKDQAIKIFLKESREIDFLSEEEQRYNSELVSYIRDLHVDYSKQVYGLDLEPFLF